MIVPLLIENSPHTHWKHSTAATLCEPGTTRTRLIESRHSLQVSLCVMPSQRRETQKVPTDQMTDFANVKIERTAVVCRLPGRHVSKTHRISWLFGHHLRLVLKTALALKHPYLRQHLKCTKYSDYAHRLFAQGTRRVELACMNHGMEMRIVMLRSNRHLADSIKCVPLNSRHKAE